MQLEIQIFKEMTFWDDSFKYVSEVLALGLGGPIKHLKGDFIWNLYYDFILSWSICISSTLPKSTFIFNTQQYQQNKSP